MPNVLQALVIAVLQGLTELFPISSLGHAVLLPAVLHWHLDQHDPLFLPFLAMLHLGTAVALLAYFWRDWLTLALGVLGQRDARGVEESRRVFGFLIIATLPAAIVGLLFESELRRLFGSPLVAAMFLAVNGLLLIFGEEWSRGRAKQPLEEMRRDDALAVGLWQCAALIPGISRSGITMVSGLLQGFDHEGSAHFSFLIALPLILGANILEAPKLLHPGVPPGTLTLAVGAAVAAGVTAFLSTAFLMRYFRRRELWALNPFAYYCVVVGLGLATWLMVSEGYGLDLQL